MAIGAGHAGSSTPDPQSLIAGPDFSHIDAWAFDLDNTLYPADCNLFRQIDARMASFIQDRLQVSAEIARRLQKEFYVRYGTTLAGLMNEHAVAPDEFLDFVHDIDLSPLAANPALADAIADLPGRKFIFTNGSASHAERVMGRLGVADAFEDIFDIRAAGWRPKPQRETYEGFVKACAISAANAAMFDDIAHNLAPAHALGMTTVLVACSAEWIADEPVERRPAAPGDRHAHVHHVTDDLAGFLARAVSSSSEER
jgi:putative hydrolase of the HAD superfamily